MVLRTTLLSLSSLLLKLLFLASIFKPFLCCIFFFFLSFLSFLRDLIRFPLILVTHPPSHLSSAISIRTVLSFVFCVSVCLSHLILISFYYSHASVTPVLSSPFYTCFLFSPLIVSLFSSLLPTSAPFPTPLSSFTYLGR